MGIEIFQFGLPESSVAIRDCINGKLNGQILQSVGQLIEGICDGEDGGEFIQDLGDPYSPEEIQAIRESYEIVQQSPHFLAVNFDGASRGHDHWAYLLGLVDDAEEKAVSNSAVFGSQTISEAAIATQGIPIRWSDANQVSLIDNFLRRAEFDDIRENFEDFPTGLYKRRSSDQLEGCLHEISRLATMFRLAAEAGLAVVTVLD